MTATTAEIAAMLAAARPLLSLPSRFDVTGVHHGYRRVVVASAGVCRVTEFCRMLSGFAPVHDAWLSWIEPGGFIVEHIDPGPHYERWQVPMSTAGVLSHGVVPVAHEVGVPFRVRHDEWHSVHNDTDEPRISLVVDRDVVVTAARTPLLVREAVTDAPSTS